METKKDSMKWKVYDKEELKLYIKLIWKLRNIYTISPKFIDKIVENFYKNTQKTK